MKKKIFNSILLSCLVGLIALSNCTGSKTENDKDNTGNHANTPPGAPASEYPGNSSDSTSNAAHPDSTHHE